MAIAAVTATFIRYICSVLAGVIYLFTVIIFAALRCGPISLMRSTSTWSWAAHTGGVSARRAGPAVLEAEANDARLVLLALPLVWNLSDS